MTAARPPRRAPGKSTGAPAFLPWLLYTCFVVYGSLVPLDFHALPWEQAWAMFQGIRLLDVGAQGRADWVANGVLYLPVGFLTANLLASSATHRVSLPALAFALLFSAALALAVEFTQLFFPPRTVSLNDLIAECIGGGTGALFAAFWADRFRSFLGAFAGAPEQMASRLLKAYVLAYFAFSLFPFDFLVSTAELDGKLHADTWGWLVAPGGAHDGIALSLAKMLGEVVAVIPLGLLIGQARAGQHPWSRAQSFFAGAALGLFIEIAQFFIVSGVSQGLSVITRGAGLLAGTLLWRQRTRLRPSVLAARFRRFGLPLGFLYLIALAGVNGWFEHPWRDIAFAVQSLSELRFIPFYYHYYTTEQAALLSLISVCAMYAPIGFLAWTAWYPPRLAMVLALVTATVMETSKLFLQGLHPDPTNLLLAGLSAWATAKLAKRLAKSGAGTAYVFLGKNMAAPRPHAGKTPLQANAITPRGQTPPRTAKLSWPGYAVLSLALAGVFWGVVSFPLAPFVLGLFLAGYALLLWFRPHLILLVVPAALPLLDLAPWSGRFFIDEFDLLLLISVAVGYTRIPPPPRRGRRSPFLFLAAILLAGTYVLGAMRGLWPLQAPDADAFASYFSPYNALRIAKGALWAFLLYGLIGRLARRHVNVRELFGRGLAIGLAGTVAVILWERSVFPGLFNFGDVYRVTGPFSQMHTGGADIETYLTVSAPFLLLLTLQASGWLARLAGAALLLGATYGVMVTFSRVGYAGYGIGLASVLLTLMLALRQGHRAKSVLRVTAALALVALAITVAAPIFQGPFAQARMARAGADLETRKAHWADALDMRDPDLATTLFGMGLGRYPETHSWRSTESKAATYRLASEGGNHFLRLGGGDPVYLEQFVNIAPKQGHVLNLQVRSEQPNARLSVSLCEKWLLTSARCVMKSIDIPARRGWQPVQVPLPSGDIGSEPWFAARPVKLSLFNSGRGTVVDVDDVHMQWGRNDDLLDNGDFAQGLARWFFSIDNDKPWHAWSLPVQVLFELGWLGVIAFGLFTLLAIRQASRRAWNGDVYAGATLGAMLGFLTIGSMSSLVDSPRMLLLFLLLAWLGGRSVGRENDGMGRKRELPRLVLSSQGCNGAGPACP